MILIMGVIKIYRILIIMFFMALVKMLISDHFHSDSALGEVDIVCKCCYGLGSTPHLLEKSTDSGSCQNTNRK